jgi:hypothetical protein
MILNDEKEELSDAKKLDVFDIISLKPKTISFISI